MSSNHTETRKAHTCSDKSGQKGISWDAVPLGLESDSEIGRRLGVSSTAVRKARLKRKIPLHHWDRLFGILTAVGIGKISDRKIATVSGKSRRSVSRYRRQLNLRGPSTVEWDKEPLGLVPDRVLATKWGVDPSTVGVARRRRGISRGDLDWVTTEGHPANYPEACIDLWMHENGIQHEFQVRIGPYIADWVIDGRHVVEYAGFEGHKKLGAAYSVHLELKITYYQKLGMTVLVLRPDVLSAYTPISTPDFHPKGKSCGLCGANFNASLRHKAKGLCRSCYRRRGSEL